jgi:hypothetical protein
LMLYIAMLSEVEQQKIDYGLLIYLKYDYNIHCCWFHKAS